MYIKWEVDIVCQVEGILCQVGSIVCQVGGIVCQVGFNACQVGCIVSMSSGMYCRSRVM